MNTDELCEAFREDVVDIAKPYLWSDNEVFRYMADAHRMFVRLIGGIADVTSDACRVDIVAGESTAELHSSILRIMSVRLESNFNEVKVVNATDLPAFSQTDYGRIQQVMLDDQQGPVRYMLIGQQKGLCRWIRIPEVDDAARLSIYRLPFDLADSAGKEISDVDEQHHLHLLDWMEHLAYKKQDAETFNKARSEEKRANFEAYCVQVKAEWERYKHKTRFVRYGGL